MQCHDTSSSGVLLAHAPNTHTHTHTYTHTHTHKPHTHTHTHAHRVANATKAGWLMGSSEL
jgi:DNA-binding IclR family transcriptional regulator